MSKEPVTDEKLLRLANAIQQITSNKEVQEVWDALDEMYYRQWKAALTPEARELLWAKSSALGDLKMSLQAAVDAGLAVAHAERQAERAANQH